MTTPIPAEGRVELRVRWDGNAVVGAEVRSRRPQPGRLLRGQSPQRAAAVIPRLYSLCGDAQTVATEAVVGLLESGVVDAAQREDWARRILLENLREHLWRLGLDWPRITGTAPWPGPLRALLVDRARLLEDRDAACEWAADTLAALFGSGFGSAEAAVARACFEDWLADDVAPLAMLLRDIRSRLGSSGHSEAPLFDASGLPAWVEEIPPRLRADADYHWRPDHRGRVYEMGPLARQQAHPILADVQRAPNSWLRVVARVLELAQGLEALCVGTAPEHPLLGRREGGEAVVVLEMARGLLVHWVRVADGLIEDYRIVAPTEWNFHPRGPAAQALRGLQATDPEALREQVALQVMALDPCVQYELEIAHA